MRTFSDPDTRRFGRAVADVGDQDGDGLADVAVSSFFTADSSAVYGSVQVFSTGDGSLLKTVIGERVDDGFGLNIARTADVNGDGRPEIATVATRANGQGAEGRGALYVFHSGGAALMGAEEAALIGEDPGEGTGTFGWSVRPGEGDDLVEVVSTRDDAGEIQYEVARWTAGGDVAFEPALALRTKTAGPALPGDALPEGAVALRSWVPSLEGDLSHRGYILESALFARAGDVNGDGAIDALDLGMVISNYGRPALRGAQGGDLDGDGAVTALDVRELVGAMARSGDPRERAMALVDSGDAPDCDDHQTGSIGESDDLVDHCDSEDSEGDGSGNGSGSDGPGGHDSGGNTGGNTGGGPDGCEIGALQLASVDAVLSGETVEVSAVITGRTCEGDPGLTWSTPSGSQFVSSSSVSADGMTLTLETDPEAVGTIEAACTLTDGDTEYTVSTSIEAFLCPQVTLEYDQNYSIIQPNTVRVNIRPSTLEGYTGSWQVVEGEAFLDDWNGTDDQLAFIAGRDEGLVLLTYVFEHPRCGAVNRHALFNIAVLPGEDSDLDNVTDACEIEIGTDPGDSFSFPGDASQEWADSDGDTLPDVQETACLGTDPLCADSDGDGWPDQCEIQDGFDPADDLSHNPQDLDTDNDGLPDLAEQCLGTDSESRDSDGDGLPDGHEVGHGLDPLDPADLQDDLDDDGLTNVEEYVFGSDPRDTDTDGDGVPDGMEVEQGSFPTDASDGGQAPDESDLVELELFADSNTKENTLTVTVGPYRVIAYEPPAAGVSEVFRYRRGTQYTATAQLSGTSFDGYKWAAHVSEAAGDSTPIVVDDPNEILGSRSSDERPSGSATVYLPIVDLDIAGYDDEEHEQAMEDDPSLTPTPLPVIGVNSGDADGDGIPNVAEGLIDGGEAPSGDGDVGASNMTRARLNVGGFPEFSEQRIVFSYDGSDPAEVTLAPAPEGDGSVAVLPPGALRIWAGRAVDDPASRNPSGLLEGGHYVAPGVEYAPSDLGIPAGGGMATLLVEAIEPSDAIADLDISVEVVDVEDGRDDLTATAVGIRFGTVDSDGNIEPAERPKFSLPSPTIESPSVSLDNVRLGEDPTTLVGDVTVSGVVLDKASNLVEGEEGVINEVRVQLGEKDPIVDGVEQEAIVPLTVQKTDDPGSIAAPHPFSGIFETTITGVRIEPGSNPIQIVARNRFGYTGYVERSLDVQVDRREYELVLHGQTGTPGLSDALSAELLVDGVSTGAVLLLRGTEPGEQNVYRSMDGSFVCTLPNEADGLPQGRGASIFDVLDPADRDGFAAEVVHPSTEQLPVQFSMVETGEGSREFVSEQAIAPDTYDLTDLAVAPNGDVFATTGGEFEPQVIEFIGPDDLNEHIETLEIGGIGQALVKHEDMLLIGHLTDSSVKAFVLTLSDRVPQVSSDPLDGMPTVTEELIAAELWYLHGIVVDTPVAIWDGAVDLYNAGVDGSSYLLTAAIGVAQGDGELVRAQLARDAMATWDKAEDVLDVLEEASGPASEVAFAILVGDHETLHQYGREAGLYMEIAAEMAVELYDTWRLEADPCEFGRVHGRVVGEVILALSSAGLSATKASTLGNSLRGLRSRAWLSRYPATASRIDNFIEYADEMATTRMCFIAGTPVQTPTGQRAIETLERGDLVLSRDERTGATGYKPIVETFATHPDALYRIRVDDGGEETDVIVSTGEHPFYVPARGGWLPAAELASGDALVLAEDGPTAFVTDVQVERGPPASGEYTTYNFEVADWHTYFVGRSGIWVHNAGAACQRVFSLYRQVQQRENLSDRPWTAWKRTLEELDALRETVDRDTILGSLRLVQRDLADKAAATPGPDGLELVRWSRLKTAMAGRLARNDLEVHHVLPKAVARELHRRRFGSEPNNGWLNSMPGLATSKTRHRIPDRDVPGRSTIHRIINEELPPRRLRQFSTDEILQGLERAYERINDDFGVEDGTDYVQLWQLTLRWWMDQ